MSWKVVELQAKYVLSFVLVVEVLARALPNGITMPLALASLTFGGLLMIADLSRKKGEAYDWRGLVIAAIGVCVYFRSETIIGGVLN